MQESSVVHQDCLQARSHACRPGEEKKDSQGKGAGPPETQQARSRHMHCTQMRSRALYCRAVGARCWASRAFSSTRARVCQHAHLLCLQCCFHLGLVASLQLCNLCRQLCLVAAFHLLQIAGRVRSSMGCTEKHGMYCAIWGVLWTACGTLLGCPT